MPGPCLQRFSKCVTETLALPRPDCLLKDVCKDTEMEINLQATPKKAARLGGLMKSTKHDNSSFSNLSVWAKPKKKHILLLFEAAALLINPRFVFNRCKGGNKTDHKVNPERPRCRDAVRKMDSGILSSQFGRRHQLSLRISPASIVNAPGTPQSTGSVWGKTGAPKRSLRWLPPPLSAHIHLPCLHP